MAKISETKVFKKIKVDDWVRDIMAEIFLDIKGITPLVTCKFCEDSKNEIKAKQENESKPKKKRKDPVKEMLQRIHFIGPACDSLAGLEKCRFGFPAVGFKQAIIRAAYNNKDIDMTKGRSIIFVQTPDDPGNELVEIFGPPPIMDERAVRINNGTTTDIRQRPMFMEWSAQLHIRFNSRMASAEQITMWAHLAGETIGIGEMRPVGSKSTGPYGKFKVVSGSYWQPEIPKEEKPEKKKRGRPKKALTTKG